MIKERDILTALINVSQEELILEGQSLGNLKTLKKKLEDELKILMEEENSEEVINIIRKKLDEIDK